MLKERAVGLLLLDVPFMYFSVAVSNTASRFYTVGINMDFILACMTFVKFDL